MEQPVTWDQLVQAAAGPGHPDRGPGHPGRGADGLGQRPHRVGRRAHHRGDRRRTRRTSSSGSSRRPPTQAAEVMNSVADRSAGRRSPRPARTPTSPTSRRVTRASWSTGRSSGAGRSPPSRPARWTSRSPTTTAGRCTRGSSRTRRAAPPYGGINLVVGAFSENVDGAYEAAECIVSEENQAYYFISNGNPAAKASVYDDPEVLEVFPQAPVIRESLENAAPRPLTVVLQRGLRRAPARVPPGDRRRPGDGGHGRQRPDHRRPERGAAAVSTTTASTRPRRPSRSRPRSGGSATGSRASASSAGCWPGRPSS